MKKKSIRYAAIIVTKDEENNIKELIKNLKKQTIKPSEIIIIDDGSKDKTQKIAKNYGCTLIRLPDRGYNAVILPEFSDNFEIGIKISLGKGYDATLILGADNRLPYDYVEKIWNLISNESNVAFASGVIKEEPIYEWARGGGRLYKNEALLKLYRKRGFVIDRVLFGGDTEVTYALMALGYTFKVFPIEYYVTRKTGSKYKKNIKKFRLLMFLSILQVPSLMVYPIKMVLGIKSEYKVWNIKSVMEFIKDKIKVKVFKKKEHYQEIYE